MDPRQPEKGKRGKRYVLVGGVLVMLVVGYLLGVTACRRGGDAERWLPEVAAQMLNQTDAQKTIGDLLGSPTMFGDAYDSSIALIEVQVVRIRQADAALRRIVPPEECREAHAMLLSESADHVLAAEYALKGVQQLDLGLLEQCIEYMESAGAKLELIDLNCWRP